MLSDILPLPLAILLLAGSAFAAGAATRPVQTTNWFTMHDAARNRDLSVSVCVPEGTDKLPLVIFSHGAYSSGVGNLPLPQFWASHGYVVIAPTHADSLLFLRRDENNDPWSGPHDFGVYGRPTTQGTWKPIWSERPKDVRFILDSLDELEKRLPPLAGRIDRSRIGMAGHSLGAYTAMMLCGAVADAPGKPGLSFADDRIVCAILMAPQGRGQQGLRDGSWDKMKLPTLVITGTYDVGVYDQPPTWREEPFLLSPPGDKYLLFIQGANHNSYMGQHVEKKSEGMPLARKGETDEKLGDAIFADVQAVTLDLLDAYLKGDVGARKRLATNEIGQSSGGRSVVRAR